MTVQSFLADFVKETTTTTGTGAKSLLGASPGCVAFRTVFGNGKTVGYVQQQLTTDANGVVTGASREIGLGTLAIGSPDTITPTAILSSTNGGAAVNWGAGTKDIFCAPPAVLIPLLVAAITGSDAGKLLKVNSTATAFDLIAQGSGNGLDADTVDGVHAAALALLAGASFTGALRAAGLFALQGDISPTALSTSQNDYNPTGLSGAAVIRQDCSANVNITGLQGGEDGREIELQNISAANTLTLVSQSASSTAGNRFNFGYDIVLLPLESIVLRYDATALRWVRRAGRNKTNAGSGTYRNLKIVTSDGATSSGPAITADLLVLEDGNGNSFRAAAVSATLDFTGTGANKLDAGSIASNTGYYLYVIAKPDGTVAALASTSATSPTLPSGYVYKMLVGWVRTKSGSAVLQGSLQVGRRLQWTISPLPTVCSGAQGVANTSYTAVSIANFVPANVAEIHLIGVSTSGSGNNLLMVAPNNNYSAAQHNSNSPPYVLIGDGSTAFSIAPESTSIYVSSQTNSLLLALGCDINL